MRKSTAKTAVKVVKKSRPKPGAKTVAKKVVKELSPEDQLAEHLEKAEHHVIAAINLFSGPAKVTRRAGYLNRLENAQEAITGLYREELVRIRGPISRRGRK